MGEDEPRIEEDNRLESHYAHLHEQNPGSPD